MFPQITEETEENLLNLEDEPKSPFSSTPPLNTTSSSSSESPPPSSPNDENQGPCPLVTVENAEPAEPPCNSTTVEEECATPPARVRMRSLSGGAYRLSTTLPATGRMRRQSGDDVLTRVSPSRRAALFEHFRPRSKSDSKGKRPTFLSNLKNTFFSGSAQRKTSLEADPPYLEPLQPGGDYRQRSRSGSETKGGTMSKMIDLFRSRSNSLSTESGNKKPLSSLVPANALLRRHSVDPDRRRKPFSSSYRSLETQQGEPYVCHTEEDGVERIDYTNMAEEKIIPTFLGSHPCYDVMPTSGKVVVFSVELLVKNAFSALLSNEIKAAPLWDAGIMDFVGMLTISDFINVLKYYYITKPEDMKDIENQSIATWRRMTGVPKKFVKINGQDSLAQAAKFLIQERIHRIPVFDEKRQCVLFVLTKKRLLQFLSQGLLEKFDKTNVRTPSFFKKTIRELKIGTFEDIAVVYKETKVIDALSIFVTRNVSALPVLNKDNILIDLFEKFDVFGLAKDQTYHNLEMTVDDVISKPYARETAWICTMDETLQTVITKFVTRKVHRLVVIDARRGVAGMISLSDILQFLVVQPLALMESATVSDTILEGTEGAVGGTEVEVEVDSPVDVDLVTGVAHMKICESSETTDDTQEEEEASAAD
ncbi:5'-AMP-activated protein kinase subunit like protein [Argiope bruennichi]|uniref:5'-AMP-activated protein kinase subunit like protein n=2 Tax=Argiope bruennichi TaxID=94029 RepID=A0A8T0EYP1_ARGBR|nr:5'-AMP-activated protein kinase subunit like protein [Argiope bruennichi]